jgi:hypothetical protein
MGVMMQAFFRDPPRVDNRQFQMWKISRAGGRLHW